MSRAASRLPEVDVEPLGDLMLDYLIEHDNEEPFLDFKETIDVSKDSPFAKIAKDIFAFANYGGGFILIGFRDRVKTPMPSNDGDRRLHIPVGLPNDFHIDQSDLQTKFNSFSNEPLAIQYREFTRPIDGVDKKFAAMYVPASVAVMVPNRDGIYSSYDGKKKSAFKKGVILFRRGTQSVPATKQEEAWIQKRASKEEYRLSVLSGQPDELQETIYSNLFEVTKLPEYIWTAMAQNNSKPDDSKKHGNDAVYIFWKNKVVTFQDLSEKDNQLAHIIDGSTANKEKLQEWLSDPDRQRIVTYLLNKELRFKSRKMGLAYVEKKQKFYFACDGQSRTISWRSRFRESSTVTVAQRLFARQLGKFVFWHVAGICNFISFGGRFFLKITPTLLLTEDGKKAVIGPEEGTVITRLVHNRYNASYLNSILFWISRFADKAENVTLATGRVLVSSKPVESKINVGILGDRPSSESMIETPEIEFGEA